MIRSRIEKIQNNLHHSHHCNLDRDRKTIRFHQGTSTLQAKGEEVNMQPAPQLPETCDVFKVSQWKWNLDSTEKWWRKLFFTRVFLPFLNFSFGVVRVPIPKEVVVESDDQGNVRRIFRWFEDEGIFPDADQADAGCLGERWGYTRLPFGRLMPPDSAQYAGTIFPRKKNPNKWAKPKMSLVVKDRLQDERAQRTLAHQLSRLNQVLDRR